MLEKFMLILGGYPPTQRQFIIQSRQGVLVLVPYIIRAMLDQIVYNLRINFFWFKQTEV